MRVGETYEITDDGTNYIIDITKIDGDVRIYGYFYNTPDKKSTPQYGLFYLDDISYMKRIDPPYKWPEGVSKDSYMAMDANGKWYIFSEKPHLNDKTSLTDWVYRNGSFAYPISKLGYKNPPTPSDWKKSLIKNI